MITFAPTNLTPDTQQLAGWLVTEALAWFQSISLALAMVTIWLAVFMVLSGLFIAFDAIIRLILRNVNE